MDNYKFKFKVGDELRCGFEVVIVRNRIYNYDSFLHCYIMQRAHNGAEVWHSASRIDQNYTINTY